MLGIVWAVFRDSQASFRRVFEGANKVVIIVFHLSKT